MTCAWYAQIPFPFLLQISSHFDMLKDGLLQPEVGKRPPKLDLPRYDLRRNIPAPDFTWEDYSPIKPTPTLFSPQSPRFEDFYNSHKIERKPKKAIPSVPITQKQQIPFSMNDEQNFKSNKATKDIKSNTENRQKETPNDTNVTIEEPKFDEFISEMKESGQKNVLFLPKDFENVRLVYRPFGCFGMRRDVEKAKKQKQALKQSENQ